MTPTEMVLTATSCTNVRCAMSATQQLIYQSKFWHAVDILDARQMEEAHALAATVPRQQRAMIRKAGAVPMSAPIPPVAGNFDRPGARAPDANTPANLLLHQALSDRQRRMEEVRHLRQHQAPGGGASFWDSEFSDALGLGKTMYLPSDEDENKGHDNNKPAVLADEYRVLCSFGDASNLQENPWSVMRQAGSPGPETQSAPGPVVVDRPASKPRLMSEGLAPGVVRPAAAVAAPKRERSPTSPQRRKNPRQHGSAPTGTSHDSEDAAQRSFDTAPASGPSGQQPFQSYLHNANLPHGRMYDHPINSSAGVFGFHPQPVASDWGGPHPTNPFANTGGPPQHLFPVQAPYGYIPAASEVPVRIAAQTPGHGGDLPSDNFGSFPSHDFNPLPGNN